MINFNPLNVLGRSIGFRTNWSIFSSASVPKSSIGAFFDVRVMNRAISESGGEAADSENLGTVHYTYDDVKNNDPT